MPLISLCTSHCCVPPPTLGMYLKYVLYFYTYPKPQFGFNKHYGLIVTMLIKKRHFNHLNFLWFNHPPLFIHLFPSEPQPTPVMMIRGWEFRSFGASALLSRFIHLGLAATHIVSRPILPTKQHRNPIVASLSTVTRAAVSISTRVGL